MQPSKSVANDSVSEPFAIVADPNKAPETLYPVADEWRTGDALDGAPVRTPSRNLASTDEGPELSSFGGDAHESEPPPMSGADAASSESEAVTKAPPRPRPATPPRLATSLPLPLRL